MRFFVIGDKCRITYWIMFWRNRAIAFIFFEDTANFSFSVVCGRFEIDFFDIGTCIRMQNCFVFTKKKMSCVIRLSLKCQRGIHKRSTFCWNSFNSIRIKCQGYCWCRLYQFSNIRFLIKFLENYVHVLLKHIDFKFCIFMFQRKIGSSPTIQFLSENEGVRYLAFLPIYKHHTYKSGQGFRVTFFIRIST